MMIKVLQRDVSLSTETGQVEFQGFTKTFRSPRCSSPVRNDFSIDRELVGEHRHPSFRDKHERPFPTAKLGKLGKLGSRRDHQLTDSI